MFGCTFPLTSENLRYAQTVLETDFQQLSSLLTDLGRPGGACNQACIMANSHGRTWTHVLRRHCIQYWPADNDAANLIVGLLWLAAPLILVLFRSPLRYVSETQVWHRKKAWHQFIDVLSG